MKPPEDGDSERPRGDETRRHPALEQRHEDDPNYHPPKSLQGLYAAESTGDLKETVYEHAERLWNVYALRDLRMRTPTETEMGDVVGQRLFDELMEAKRELWRRWQAGDQTARLPEFSEPIK